MRRPFTAAIAVITALAAHAALTFGGGTAHFGLIREADGPKTIRIYLRNDTTVAEAILKVRPTCGCTAASFQSDPVAPGDSAWIDLTYDPRRRPGRFEKAVKIYPSEGEMIRIPIAGTVVASEQTIAQLFPVDAGLLHLSESTLLTLSPLDKERRSLYVDIYNSGSEPVLMRLEGEAEAIDTEPFPDMLGPGEKGFIGVYIDPAKEPRSGRLEYPMRLLMSLTPDFENPSSFPIIVKTEK